MTDGAWKKHGRRVDAQYTVDVSQDFFFALLQREGHGLIGPLYPALGSFLSRIFRTF